MTRSAMLALLLASALAPAVQAAPCAGFTDVEDTNPFCRNVEWVRNRSVTLGCISSSLYCPDAAVSRLAMAAFLSRLGGAMTPEYVYRTDNRYSFIAELRVCATLDYPVAGFPRRAVVDGLVNVYSSNTTQGVVASVEISSNAGMTWSASPFFSAPGYARVTAAAGDEFTIPVMASFNLEPGASYRFALKVDQYTGTLGEAEVLCRLRARIENREVFVISDPALEALPARQDDRPE